MLHQLDPVPVVRRLDTDNDRVFAIEIAGHATAADAENLFGLLEGAYALHDRIDILVRATAYDRADWGDIDPDTIAEGRKRAEQRVSRCAVVGGPDWTTSLGGFFSAGVPVELRYFAADQEADAWAWLGARERRLEV